jgi:hypothetical protein
MFFVKLLPFFLVLLTRVLNTGASLEITLDGLDLGSESITSIDSTSIRTY